MSDQELLADALASAQRWQARLAAGKTRADRAKPVCTKRLELSPDDLDREP